MNALMIKVLAGLLLLGGLFLFEQHRMTATDQRGYDRATSERAARDGLAVLKRVDENAVKAAANESINKFLTKDHDEKLAPVVAAITSDRVRIGPAICAGRPSAPAKVESPSGSDAADTAGRLVQEQLERDIRALEIRVEEALATGRTCQQFMIEHDMAP